MQDDPCIFYWQEKLANGRTQSAPRSGRTIKPHYKEVPPRAVAGEARPLKRMRRDRDRGARTPIIRVRNSWIGGRAVVQIPRGQRQARQVRLDRVRRIFTQQIAGRSINRGGSYRARCFRNGRRRLESEPTTAAVPARRWPHCRSVVGHRLGGCGQGGSNVSRQRRYGPSHAGTGHKFTARWRKVVELALYTVEGRQAADLRQKCGSALIRKAKLPSRSCGSLSLFGKDG